MAAGSRWSKGKASGAKKRRRKLVIMGASRAAWQPKRWRQGDLPF